MTARRLGVLWLSLLGGVAAPRDAGAQGTGAVDYGDVDASTFRVFAIGPVGLDSFEFRGETIQYAVTNAGHGTGFAVGADGLIATAHHVVADALHVVVRRPGDGGFAAARVVYKRKDDDIAILWIEDTLRPLALIPADERLRVRQTAFAVGYPLDPTRAYAQSARGIIAGHLEDGTIQIDMDLNPGNSGGPLLDEQDRVIGMVVARASGDGAQGIGYAVPVAKLAAAASEAAAAVRSRTINPLTEKAHQSAVVVDQLIQSGALRNLKQAGDLSEGLTSDRLEREVDDIGRGVYDGDLLVFMAGNLWNASLVLRYGDVRRIGNTSITTDQARSLADRLSRAAIDLCARAAQQDASLPRRSAFVAFAQRRSPQTPSVAAP